MSPVRQRRFDDRPCEDCASAAGPRRFRCSPRLLGDAEIDIREGAVAGVIAVYVQPPAKRSIGSAADAFEAARFHVQPWSVPPELSAALVKALADE